MSKAIAVIMPDEAQWKGMRRLFALWGIDIHLILDIKEFLEKDLPRDDTVILLNTGNNIERHLSLASNLVLENYAGVIAIADELSRSERIALMNIGIDYCLEYPINEQELCAISKNLFRRRKVTGEPSKERTGRWMLDLEKWNLRTPMGHNIGLSLSERSVLAVLLREPGKAMPRYDIKCSLKQSADCNDRSVDVLISRLRRKVEDASSIKLPLHSARGTGYVFTSSATIIQP